MKPSVSPFSMARQTRGHGAGADEGGLAGFADFGFGEADAAERRIGVEGVDGNAVADAARIVVEEVGGDDLEVVVGGVGEGAAAVAVAEGPDAGDVGAELVVDGDVAAVVVLRRRPCRGRGRRCWGGGPRRGERGSRRCRSSSSSQLTPTAMSSAA